MDIVNISIYLNYLYSFPVALFFHYYESSFYWGTEKAKIWHFFEINGGQKSFLVKNDIWKPNSMQS